MWLINFNIEIKQSQYYLRSDISMIFVSFQEIRFIRINNFNK